MARRSDDEGYYRVLLDEEWQLDDLYEFSHAFAQNYAFVFCLDAALSSADRARIDRALEGYPWRGGYSYVNIYTVLQNQVSIRERPRIKSINKSSPGWLDLFLNVDVAIQVAQSVAIISGAAVAVAVAYKNISKALLDIRTNQRRNELQELQITQREGEILNSMSTEMAEYLGFKNLRELNKRTKNPEVTLKLLLAHCRRIQILAKYVHEGKANLPVIGHNDDN